MLTYFTYELPNGQIQSAAANTVAEALQLCEGQNNAMLLMAIESIPAMLKAIRKHRGLTLDQVAELLPGYSKQTLSAIETGRRPIGFKLLKDFGDTYGVKFGLSANTVQ